MPKSTRALIHYSTAEVDVFDVPNGHFNVRTQGRLYTIGVESRTKIGVTRALAPRSALLFTDAALDKFSTHSFWTLNFFKRLFGQHRTLTFGDVTWKMSDTVRQGDVLQIKDIQIVPIKDRRRGVWQRIKVVAARTLDAVVFGSMATAMTVILAIQFRRSYDAPYVMIEKLVPGIYDYLDTVGPWLLQKLPFVLAGLLVILTILLIQASRQLETKCFRDDLSKLGY
ncbi:hypothetical protein H8F22_07015 [Pseudomonas sp. P154a]|uniref:hypothetical protein n=1 Tax=Pseudomonas mucoides TaxID=2730424 RepID=UPI0018927407|nr:hypothetical protein [Pseudomonas mucoides]MBF6038614.1 hypothetical protein [Pseudomonas mucoides]